MVPPYCTRHRVKDVKDGREGRRGGGGGKKVTTRGRVNIDALVEQYDNGRSKVAD